jgi:hypothetical protein
MAMLFYTRTLPVNASHFDCNGCGTALAFYSSPAALLYGT